MALLALLWVLEFGRSDSFIVVTTEDDQFYIYEYMFAQVNADQVAMQNCARFQIDASFPAIFLEVPAEGTSSNGRSTDDGAVLSFGESLHFRGN